jgi:hypothetical protein
MPGHDGWRMSVHRWFRSRAQIHEKHAGGLERFIDTGPRPRKCFAVHAITVGR